jgi:hydrogenase expression/formation protein HypD
MEVCGGQTHSLLKHGIEAELSDVVELIHGPGCPVCVTPATAIDFAQQLALQPGVILASFGDMLRVPGSTQSLLDVRSQGGDVRIVYSPLDAVALAQKSPDHEVVFFAVGFETTAPTTALAVQQADRLGLKNFSLLVAHVRVLPAMEAIVAPPDCRVEGFLAAGHVCTVMGSEDYRSFVERYLMPVVVTGFEPVDLLDGILDCVRQLEAGDARVTNRYARSVRDAGNRTAQDIVSHVYEAADTPWRGLGTIPRGGYRLRGEFRRFDVRERFADLCGTPIRDPDRLQQPELTFAQLPATASADRPAELECRSGDVLRGQIKPIECSAFGTTCTPDSPLGAPMVSGEGACAAYFKYHRPA